MSAASLANRREAPDLVVRTEEASTLFFVNILRGGAGETAPFENEMVILSDARTAVADDVRFQA